LRINKASIVLRKQVIIGDTDVSRKIFTIVLMMFILIYVSSGTWMVIENIPLHICEQYKFHEIIYFTVVTLSTVGYGDIFPRTDYGKLFTSSVIIFTIIIMIPR